jgi:hypothetical protein
VNPGLALNLGCKHANTKKIISSTTKHWVVKVPPENIKIRSKLDPAAQKQDSMTMKNIFNMYRYHVVRLLSKGLLGYAI